MITEDEIRSSLAALDHALAVKGIRGEICLFDGAVMVLAFHARQSTKDVDAIPSVLDASTRIPACHEVHGGTGG